MSSDYVRDLLRMASGESLSGRGNTLFPDEIADALAGDVAQEAMMKEQLLTEQRHRTGGSPEFVGLDLSEMESHEVDHFLHKARKHIIKRNKHRRHACCQKIGGVLQQMFGPAGGEHGEPVDASDRGAEDPIGESDDPRAYPFPTGHGQRPIPAWKPYEKHWKHDDDDDGPKPKSKSVTRPYPGDDDDDGGPPPPPMGVRVRLTAGRGGSGEKVQAPLRPQGIVYREDSVEECDAPYMKFLKRSKKKPLGEALSHEHKRVYAFRKGEGRGARAKRIAHYKKTGKILGEGYSLASPAVDASPAASSGGTPSGPRRPCWRCKGTGVGPGPHDNDGSCPRCEGSGLIPSSKGDYWGRFSGDPAKESVDYDDLMALIREHGTGKILGEGAYTPPGEDEGSFAPGTSVGEVQSGLSKDARKALEALRERRVNKTPDLAAGAPVSDVHKLLSPEAQEVLKQRGQARRPSLGQRIRSMLGMSADDELDLMALIREHGLDGLDEAAIFDDWWKKQTPEERARINERVAKAKAEQARTGISQITPYDPTKDKSASSASAPSAPKPLKPLNFTPGPRTFLGMSADDELDLMAFVAEEFGLHEHDSDCEFAIALFNQLSEEEKFIQKAIKKPGALRAHFGLKADEEIPVKKAWAEYKMLQKKADKGTLSKDEIKLFRRLQLFLKVLRKVNHESVDPMSPEDAGRISKSITRIGQGGARGRAMPMPLPSPNPEQASAKKRGAASSAVGTGRPDIRPDAPDPSFTQGKWTKSWDPDKNQWVSQTEATVDDTAQALAGFFESLGYGNNYEKGGYRRQGYRKAPGNMEIDLPCHQPRKDAPYNDAYDTEPVALKSGLRKNAGMPSSPGKSRGVDAGDPIGEDELYEGSSGISYDPHASETAHALASFMEAVAWPMHKQMHDAGVVTRKDDRKHFGGQPVKPTHPEKPRYAKGANPIGGASSKQLRGMKSPKR